VPPARYSPVFRFPLDAVVAALASAPLGLDGAKRVRYVNPQTGGPVMSLLDCWMIALEPGAATRPFRTNAHGICAVVRGSGRTTVGANAMNWEARDVFTLPSDAWITHESDEAAMLFVVSDRELYRNLAMLTAEYR
jgi:gentisate 1,2-dioxygenase